MGHIGGRKHRRESKVDDFIKNRKSLKRAIVDAYFGGVNDENLTELQNQNLQFAISSNERGFNTLRQLYEEGVCVQDRRILDIGCAYGGYTIEARRRGAAVAYGVDINRAFIDFAKLNLSDEKEDMHNACKFLCIDITSEQSAILPRNYFDIVILNDVFEHIYDTTRLMQIINRVVEPNCTMYFEIPNGLHFFDFVEREPHYFEYGMSFLEPYYVPYKDVYYRRWEYYVALFSYFGFKKIQILNPKPNNDKNTLLNEMSVKWDRIRNTLQSKYADENSELAKLVISRLKAFESEMMHDMDELDIEQLNIKYMQSFWKGIAYKS